MNIIKRTLVAWIPLAILASMVAFTGYVLVQQAQRSAANDPQIQMAEDTARALNSGLDPKSIAGTELIDAGVSLAPFVIVYDQEGKVLGSDAQIHGAVPVPPQGIFDYVSGKSRDGGAYSLRKTDVPGEERFSWEPQSGLRFATVVTKYDGGYVLVARSMHEVGKRIQYTFGVSVFAYLLGLGLTFVWCLLVAIYDRKRYN